LSQGALEIIPTKTAEEAFHTARTFPSGTTLLAGERGNRKIPGFDLGNSPKEYVSEKVKGKRLILTTTNGTKALHLVSSGKEVLVGSFLNIGALAKRCIELEKDLFVFPSGASGDFSLEDTICGGMLIESIIQKEKKSIFLTDASQCARVLCKRFESNLLDAFRLSHHGNELINHGFGDDLAFCGQIDITDTVPVFKDGVIRVALAPASRQADPPTPQGGERKAKSKRERDPLRHPERELKDQETITALLRQVPIGRIATVNQRGVPVIKPVTFLYLDGKIYIHSSMKGEKIEDIQRGSPICFEVDEPFAYVVSGELACKTNFYYRSIIVKGNATLLSQEDRKVKILEKLMEKYQPEGGIRKFEEGVLKKTAVIEISIEEITGKENLG
jgi:2-phosphosulfolactate phosphatase